MSKRHKHGDSAVFPEQEINVADLMSAMQESLESIHKKLDLLLVRPQSGSAEEKHFSKPFQRFDRNRQHGRGGQSEGFRERRLFRVICAECGKECEVPFNPTGDRPVYCKECFTKRKDSRGPFRAKFEHRPKEDDFAMERHFNKKRGADKGFDRKKKSFSRKKK